MFQSKWQCVLRVTGWGPRTIREVRNTSFATTNSSGPMRSQISRASKRSFVCQDDLQQPELSPTFYLKVKCLLFGDFAGTKKKNRAIGRVLFQGNGNEEINSSRSFFCYLVGGLKKYKLLSTNLQIKFNELKENSEQTMSA